MTSKKLNKLDKLIEKIKRRTIQCKIITFLAQIFQAVQT